MAADLKELCTKLDVKEDKIKDWPQDMTVYTEHPSYFYDMMTKPMLSQACTYLCFKAFHTRSCFWSILGFDVISPS